MGTIHYSKAGYTPACNGASGGHRRYCMTSDWNRVRCLQCLKRRPAPLDCNCEVPNQIQCDLHGPRE